MKKLCVLLILLLLVGCGSSEKKLTEFYDDSHMKNMTNDLPKLIEISDYDYGPVLYVEDSDEIKTIVDLFSKIKINEKTGGKENNRYDLSFVFADDQFFAYTIVDDLLLTYDESQEIYYQLIDSKELTDYLKDRFEKEYGVAQSDYQEVLHYEDICVKLGGVKENEEGNLNIDLATFNPSSKYYGFKLKTKINGFDLFEYQTIILSPESDTSYTMTLPTRALKHYGIEKLGKIDFSIELYNAEEETYDLLDKVYESESYEVLFNDYESLDKEVRIDDVVFEDEEAVVCLKSDYEDYFANLSMYYENKTDKPVTIDFAELKFNDENQDVADLNDVFKITVNANEGIFVFVPYPTFDSDSDGNIIKKEVDSLWFVLNVNDDKKIEVLAK